MKLKPKTIGFNLKSREIIKEPYFDLAIAFWLIDPDLKDYSPEKIFSVFIKKEWSGKKEDIEAVYAFAEKKLKEYGLIEVFYEIEMPMLKILGEMERSGIGIDMRKIKKLKKELEDVILGLEKKIYRYAGRKFNLNSPKQLGEVLFKKLEIHSGKDSPLLRKTPKGETSTNFEQLSAYADKHPIIRPILEYRSAHKILRTYADPIIGLIGKDGRLHTTYVQTGTATGRLSSENPNLQNVPVAEEVSEKNWGRKLRECFVARSGFELVAFDYSQLELRIIASVSEDKAMIQSFLDGKDIHAITAAQIFSVPVQKVTKEMRRIAKTLNFGVVYGMGSMAFARSSGLSLSDARKFIESYFETFPNIKIWQEGIIREARETGYVMTLTGRRRNLKGILSPFARVAAQAERIAINMPIQGLEADIMKYAMIKSRQKLEEKKWWGGAVRMLLTIHDELLFEVRNDIINEAASEIIKSMEGAYSLRVPLKINPSRGKSWGNLSPFLP